MASSSRTNISSLVIIITVALLLVAISAFTRYIYAKDYYFSIETPCDAETQICYIRSCDDYCPPNGLEVYSTYLLKASDYGICTSNSCENICTEDDNSLCSLVTCEESGDQECSETNN